MNPDLEYAINHDILDTEKLHFIIEMEKRKELLNKHPYQIWQGKNGKWYTYFDVDKERKLKKLSTKEAIEDAIVAYWKEKIESPTVKEAFSDWIEWKFSLQKIERTTYERYCGVFRKFYSEWENRRLVNITPEEFRDFLEEQIPKHNLSAKSFSNLKTITRGFLRRAKRKRIIFWSVEDMFSDIEVSDRDFRKIVKEDYEEVYDEDEMYDVMSYIYRNQDPKNLGIMLMFVTGLRVGELVALKHSDIEDGYIKIRRTEVHHKNRDGEYEFFIKDSPKTAAGIRKVIIPKEYDWLMKKIKRISPFGEYVFVQDGKRLNEKQIEYRLYKICKRLNIYYKSPHKIRKTYISILLDSKVDSRMVIDQVGHVDVSISEQHYHRNRKSIERKQNILSSIDELNGSYYRFDYPGNKGNSKNGIFMRKTGIS